jgi:hypothetical protein
MSETTHKVVKVPDNGIVGVPEIVVDVPLVGKKLRPGGRAPENVSERAGVEAFVRVNPDNNGLPTVRVWVVGADGVTRTRALNT